MKAAVCLLLATAAVAAAAAPTGPGEAAVDFLEKVRQRQLDLAPGGDTALSPHTEEAKRQKIAKRLERIAGDLGAAPLEVGAVKEDDDFAAVLVRKVGGYDPAGLQVFAVALVKRGAEWLAAPVPASFENSGTAYASSLRDRLTALEDWMMREQVADLQQLRDGAAERMRSQIEDRLSAESLRGFSAREAAGRFIDAAARRDLASMLGLLGGLSPELPADWSQRLRAAENAATAPPGDRSPWRLLTGERILREIVRVEESGDEALITVAFLDPIGRDSESPAAIIESLSLSMKKDRSGLWQIEPPVPVQRGVRRDKRLATADLEGVDAFPSVWRKNHPAVPQIGSQEMAGALENALHQDDLPTLLSLLALPDTPADARRAFLEAANFWQSFREAGHVQLAIPLAFRNEPSAAAALYQVFSSRDPGLFTPKSVLFEKSADGWLWSLRPDPEVRAGFRDWLAGEIANGKSGWRGKFFAQVPAVTDLENQQAPPEEAAAACAQDWLAATGSRDVRAALASMTRHPDERSETAALQNLGYELGGARIRTGEPRIRGIYRDGPWTGVGVEVSRKSGQKLIHPFLVVVGTSAGPRVLAEIDLFGTGDHTRDFLNKNAFIQLERAAGKAATDQLRALFTRYQRDLQGQEQNTPTPLQPGN